MSKIVLKGVTTIAVLLFFFNRAWLPYNLQWAILLFPFFFYYLVKSNLLKSFFKGAGLILIWSVLHSFVALDKKSLWVSTTVLISLWAFVLSFYIHFRENKYTILIQKLTLVNIALVGLAIFALFSETFKDVFWYLIPITPGYPIVPRLKLFELEASHYSLAIIPLAVYWFWAIIDTPNRRGLFYLFTLAISLLLSFSIGIWGALFICLMAIFLFYLKDFLKMRGTRNLIFVSSGLLVASVFLLVYVENPLQFRLQNLLDGKDTSGRGRTYEAFDLAWQTLKYYNVEWFGIGLGQFKTMGKEILLDYYQYQTIPTSIRLPNGMAETLVTYGIIGFLLKLIAQVYLFLKLRVFSNLFQLSIFMIIFVYQFTGSYLFNSMEYILWVLAFVPSFRNFGNSNIFPKKV